MTGGVPAREQTGRDLESDSLNGCAARLALAFAGRSFVHSVRQGDFAMFDIMMHI
jgi:hypothetical protein